MFQQITPAFSYAYWAPIFSKPGSILRICLLLVATNSLHGLNATPTSDGFVSLEAGAKMASDTSLEASICAGETYLFNGELLNASGEYIAIYPLPDGSDSVVTLQLTVLPVSLTNLEVSICEGASYPFNGQNFDQTGTYTAILPAENGCDSIIALRLTVLAPIKTSLEKAICVGTFYVFQGDTLTESGLYSIVLTSSAGCDSIVTLNLNVVSFFETTINASICPGSTYSFADTVLSVAGIYMDSLTAIGGCDSIIRLNLSIRPTVTTPLSASICAGAEYNFNGEILTDIGTYEAVFTGSNGCDSTVVLTLDVVDFYDIQINASICTGEFYFFDGDLLEFEGEYIYQYVAQGGCDSTVTLTLQVLPVSVGAGSATICPGDAYDYNGEILTDEGVYTFVLDAANGCDSTVTFTLNVLPAITTALEASICEGETYIFNGDTLNTSGVYDTVLSAENGCDSVVTLSLTVLPLQQNSLSVAICAGEFYDYNGDTLTNSGTYTFVFAGENGCDSTFTLVLTVNPLQSVTLDVNICEGESYPFDGTLISDAGTYTAIFSDENGCDSTVTLLLGILPLQNTTVESTICANETYLFNGDTLNSAGIYTAILTGINGCDSTVVLTLDVLPIQNTQISATICEGNSFDYNGFPLSTAGDFDFIFGGENGCDSVVTVRIAVLPISETSISATICDGDTYDYNGVLFADEGVYQFVFVGFNGCDSTVTLSVTVLPLAFTTLEVSLCVGSAYVFNGDTLKTSGVYTHVSTGFNGCDSTATLVLEFVSAFITDLEASICAGESYIFGNDTLTDTGNYNQLLIAQGGCDSLIVLVLNVLPKGESTTDASICDGGSYTFNGLDLNTGGTYTAVFTGSNGCDSTAILNLTVLPLLNAAVEATICANQTYDFNGQTLSDAGNYTAVVTGSNGCDSTVVLTLNVLPTLASSLSASICANQTYDFNGQVLSQAGTYTALLLGTNGCDSVVTLGLEVLPLAQTAFAVSVCNGQSFEYNNEVLTQSGEYVFSYPGAAANGCDSIETLFLTIFPAIAPTNITASICEGETYDFYGTTLTTSGTFSTDLSSSVGCDSTIVLTLTVNSSPVVSLEASICDGELYPFNGNLLGDPGTYTAQLQTAAGCDSTVVLTLLVNTVTFAIILDNFSITVVANNATFQWIDCATNLPIQGATGSTFIPAVTGNYAVIVTQNGCKATSLCFFVMVVSTNEPLAEQAWNLQPNPASSQTQLVFVDESAEDLWLEIHDLAGRLLYSQNVATGTRSIDLNLSDMPSGILVVRLASEKGVSAKRLMKAER